MHDWAQKIMMRTEFGISQYIPEYNRQYKGNGWKDIDSGRCKCCCSVFHSQVVEVLIQHWPVKSIVNISTYQRNFRVHQRFLS